MPSDLAVSAFQALRAAFFDNAGRPVEFDLRDKLNTQDDPLDVYVHDVLCRAQNGEVTCVQAPGPLVSPDMALVRNSAINAKRSMLRDDASLAIGIEVKKVERASNGAVGRASGLDYNSTPPCGTIRVYDGAGKVTDMRGFYLFVCSEVGSGPTKRKITAMALCDGDLLNSDFKYYIDITGERTKDIGVGSYGDGANRNRPMVIFANPLGFKLLDRAATLIHRDATLADDMLLKVGTIRRPKVDAQEAVFTCYRTAVDETEEFDVRDPFPTPSKRTERTSGRGRFNLGVRIAD